MKTGKNVQHRLKHTAVLLAEKRLSNFLCKVKKYLSMKVKETF
jgi:hypothetical protein